MAFLGGIFQKKKDKVQKPESFRESRTYDYATEENRIATAEWLFDQSRIERTTKEADWIRYNEYYNFNHDARKELGKMLEEMNIPWSPAVVPDAFIMVESQIVPDVPQPEFHGRDTEDDEKAVKRQKAVKYVTENNGINDMNTANERRLRKYGDAFWKAYWDQTMMCGEKEGDIRIKDIALEDIYPDPTAMCLEECEYVDYVYTIHKNQFYRLYHEILNKKGYSVDDIMSSQYRQLDGVIVQNTESMQSRDDMVQILEHWFRQPYDGSDKDSNGNTVEFESGDIACTIQAGGIELKYIPKYWKNTGKQNKLFPFVHYWCINDETGFWNKSELDPIIDLIDAADRELTVGILNDALMSNDVILVEDGALADGQTISNAPGQVINVKQGRSNGIGRLGGLTNGINSMQMVNWLLNQVQRANRNYDTNNGQETAKVTTASGLLQLRSDAAVQGELKKADRNNGFRRLYELIDWLCLEFFDDDRLLYIGAIEDEDELRTIRYNSAEFITEKVFGDPESGEEIIEKYYPRVDVTVTTGNGISKNPATTMQILDKLAAIQVTAENYKLLSAELDLLDIPQKNEIVNEWKKKFESEVPEQVITALQQNPELLQAVEQLIGGIGQQVPTGDTSMAAADVIQDTALPEMII